MLRRIFASHDVKQPFSSLSSNATLLLSLQTAALNPAAPCGGRVASYCSHRPRTRGGWSADRRTHSLGRACDARPPCPGATGTSLGAPPWRFSDADPRSRLPAVEPEPQRLPAPSINARRSGSGPPALRFAPQSRDATPCSVSRIVSGRRPLLSQDANRIAHIRYVVNIFLRIVVIVLVAKATRKRPGSPCKPCELRNRSAGMRPVRYEQQRPVIASATRSSSLSRSCAWSCA